MLLPWVVGSDRTGSRGSDEETQQEGFCLIVWTKPTILSLTHTLDRSLQVYEFSGKHHLYLGPQIFFPSPVLHPSEINLRSGQKHLLSSFGRLVDHSGTVESVLDTTIRTLMFGKGSLNQVGKIFRPEILVRHTLTGLETT